MFVLEYFAILAKVQVKVKDSPSTTSFELVMESPAWMKATWMLEVDVNSWVLGQALDE